MDKTARIIENPPPITFSQCIFKGVGRIQAGKKKGGLSDALASNHANHFKVTMSGYLGGHYDSFRRRPLRHDEISS